MLDPLLVFGLCSAFCSVEAREELPSSSMPCLLVARSAACQLRTPAVQHVDIQNPVTMTRRYEGARTVFCHFAV